MMSSRATTEVDLMKQPRASLTYPLLLFALLLTILVMPAQAAMIVNTYTNDFSVESPYASEPKACACESRADRVTVTNTGAFLSSYTVSVHSEQPWYQLQGGGFTLAPGESRDVLVYAEPPCDATGTSRYSIRVASSYGRERVLSRTLDVKKCQNAFLTVQGGVEESNLCQPLEYMVTVRNVAEFADTFTLDFGAFNAYADLKERSFSLVPDEQRKLLVTITPPCSLYGEISIPFIVTSEKNKVTEQKEMRLVIENQFDHDISIATQTEICSRIASRYTFNITNLIDVPNTYDVIVTGPGFLDYDPKQLELKGHESKQVTLTLNPKKGQEGTHEVKVKVRSRLGEITKTRVLDVDVFDCFAYEFGFVEQARDKDGSYAEVACCGETSYTLNLRNAGQTEETYNLLVDGPSWFQPEERTIRLKPSENRNVRFAARLPCTDERYELPVTVVLTNHPEIADTIIFRVESQTLQTCHAVEASVTSVTIAEDDAIVPFLVKSTGIQGGTYRVAVDGELYAAVSEERITLAPGEEKALHLITKGNLTDYFDGKYLSMLTLTHEPLGLEYAQPFWTRFAHNGLLVTAWRALAGYDYASVALCLWAMLLLALLVIATVIIIILTLLGVLRRPKIDATLLWALRVALLVVVALLIILLVVLPLPAKDGLYEDRLEDDESGMLLQWYENERFTLDLAQYFADPDDDRLEFFATQPAHVRVVITGSTATLIPDANWGGEESLIFTASDQRGGYTDSPLFTLSVLRRTELTFGQWLARYCRHLNLALLLVLALLWLLWLFLAKQEVKPPREQKKGGVHTVVAKEGAVRKLGVGASHPPSPVDPQSARSLDQAFVACGQEHEMRSVLKAHGKRATKGNIATVQAACRAFKADTRWTPNNRETFYRYLSANRTLAKLESKAESKERPLVDELNATRPRRGRPPRRGSAASALAFVPTRSARRVDERVEVPQQYVETPSPFTQVNVAVGANLATERKEFVLIGAKNGNKVHDPKCMIAHRIPRKNRVTFTSKEAAQAGYGPCKVCQAFGA